MVVPADDTGHPHVANRAVLTVEVTSENSSGVDHDQKFHEYAFYTDLNDSFALNAPGIAVQVGEVCEGVF